MSAGTEFRETRKARAFRKLVEKCGVRRGASPWQDLPEGSFRHSGTGTNVNTVMVRLRKPA